jgi:hypothetical protein
VRTCLIVSVVWAGLSLCSIFAIDATAAWAQDLQRTIESDDATAPSKQASGASYFAPQTLGVNIHFTQPLPGELEMIAAAGIGWIRTDFDWASTEQSMGVYDFSAYDGLLADLASYHIRAILILDYANPLYDKGLSPYDDEGRAAFAAWAAAAAVHFRGHDVVWEMYNEPDLTWTPRPNAEAYAKLALAVGKSLREAVPQAIYIGPALSYRMNFFFLRVSLEAGLLTYWSAVSVHPYRQIAPETAESDYQKLRLLIAEYAPSGKNIPIVSSEWGYSTYWNGFNNEVQSKFLAREWLVNRASEIPLSIWYDWRDDPPDRQDPEESHFGIVFRRYFAGRQPVFDPKQAYTATKTANQLLTHYDFVRRIAVASSEDWVLVFQDAEGHLTVVVWTTGEDHNILIPLAPGLYTVRSYLGQSLPALIAGPEGLTIQLTDAPRYLTREMELACTTTEHRKQNDTIAMERR